MGRAVAHLHAAVGGQLRAWGVRRAGVDDERALIKRRRAAGGRWQGHVDSGRDRGVFFEWESESNLSTALYEHSPRGRILARNAAWNHALMKVAALQALHGWQRYVVVFKRNPLAKDAARYCKAGLVWCTIKTLPDFLHSVELLRHGFYIPFQFRCKSYSFTVTAEQSSKGFSHADVEFIDRGRYVAAVSASRYAEAAQRAQVAADEAAGIEPF